MPGNECHTVTRRNICMQITITTPPKTMSSPICTNGRTPVSAARTASIA
jgi:hypothetical protein